MGLESSIGLSIHGVDKQPVLHDARGMCSLGDCLVGDKPVIN